MGDDKRADAAPLDTSPAARYLASIGDAEQRPGSARSPGHNDWRSKLYTIIFKADTPLGKAFDLWLIVAILVSVAVVMLASVRSIWSDWRPCLEVLELTFTGLFVVEYVLRLLCAPEPRRYAFGFWGLVDVLSFLPTFLVKVLPNAKVLVVVRMIRILRLFQVLKLGRYMQELDALNQAVRRGWRKILVFVYVVSTLVVILGAVMFLAEGEKGGFTSIPRSVYWAIVTMTTVGYGDISPVSPIGQTIAALVMLMGYSIIVVPTGILSAEMFRSEKPVLSAALEASLSCASCAATRHDTNAQFCKLCGSVLQRGARDPSAAAEPESSS